MKLFEIKKLKEAQRTKTQTKTATDEPDLSAFRRAFQDQTMGTPNLPAEAPAEEPRQPAATPELKRATAAQTRARTAGVEMPPEAARKLTFLQTLGLDDEISDEEAARRAGVTMGDEPETPATYGVDQEPRTPGTELATIENMPAQVNREISADTSVEPDWHQVKHLPGYLKSAIRAMGRQVFGVYTETPIEDIQVIANVSNSGQPNSARELNAVGSWLVDNAQRDTEGEMNFQQSIPDYQADFQIYTHEGYTFMVVQDFAGNYIYSWPTADNKDLTNQQGAQGAERPRIGRQPRRLR